MKNSITLQLSPQEIQSFFVQFKDYQTKTPPYALWSLKLENCVVTYYASHKCLFQGKDASIYASVFSKQEESKKLTLYPQAGSDEVGTGDYFGPVVVCAAYVQEDQLPVLQEYQVTDSKAMTDTAIRQVAKELASQFPHAIHLLKPEQYNLIQQSYNLNAIKSLLHNQAYLSLSKQVDLPDLCMVDQFAEKDLFYRYIAKEKHVVSHLSFETKAESHYPSVALASVLARNTFLEYWDKLEKEYDFHFQKGASALVDQNGKEFVKRYGESTLKKVAKLHFSNTKRIKSED